MNLRKIRDAFSPGRAETPTVQPPYHTEIDDDYLAALQRQVDAEKPAGFTLTPIGQPGW